MNRENVEIIYILMGKLGVTIDHLGFKQRSDERFENKPQDGPYDAEFGGECKECPAFGFWGWRPIGDRAYGLQFRCAECGTDGEDEAMWLSKTLTPI